MLDDCLSERRAWPRWVAAPLVGALALVGVGCSKAAATPPSRAVLAAPPPKDDGGSAQGGTGGDRHSAALEQLKGAAMGTKSDKQNSLVVPLPDARRWTRVKFLTVKTLVGFRYGREHHAVVGGFVTHVDDNTVQGACSKSFEGWATPMIEAFEVELKHGAPVAFPWSAPSPPAALGESPPVKRISIVDVDPLTATTATVLAHETYEGAWAAYPAWGDKACLIVGVAVPVRQDRARAREVRDRFVRDVFPKIAVTGHEEPKERY